MILLNALGYFAVVVWFRDRVVNWRPIGLGLLALVLLGLAHVVFTVLAILSGLDHSDALIFLNLGDAILFFFFWSRLCV
ncbi:MAG: hypothetical protein KTR15_06815 [Phycisphaeraceae bacterium]|nr:hypothetical protein [Phycisphaeraceae bacterium]